MRPDPLHTSKGMASAVGTKRVPCWHSAAPNFVLVYFASDVPMVCFGVNLCACPTGFNRSVEPDMPHGLFQWMPALAKPGPIK